MDPRVEFKIDNAQAGACEARLEVAVNGEILAAIEGAPLEQLRSELAAWVDAANDASPTAFIFSGGGRRDLLGTFRIEPRPIGWQFTSTVEMGRHAPLPLAEFVTASRTFCRVADAP